MRKPLDTIRQELATLAADNTSGEFSLAEYRQITGDMLDSAVQDECGLVIRTPAANYPITGAWTLISGVYTEAIGGDGTWLIPDLNAGQIQGNAEAGWSYNYVAQLSFEADANEVFNVALSYDGVPSAFEIAVTGRGNGRPVTANLVGYDLTADASQRVGVSLQSDGSVENIDILFGYVGAIIMPTQNLT